MVASNLFGTEEVSTNVIMLYKRPRRLKKTKGLICTICRLIEPTVSDDDTILGENTQTDSAIDDAEMLG